MTENLSDTGIILEVLGDLELPLLKAIEKTDTGYEIMVTYPENQKLTKELLQHKLEEEGLKVIDIDVFREKSERYAWIIVIPEKKEEEVGRD